jgi:hypothetical protein
VTLSRESTGRFGAYLQLKRSDDMVTGVTVNGKPVSSLDQSQEMIDVGRYLKAGLDTIQVRLVTTLVNRVKVPNLTFIESMRPRFFPHQELALASAPLAPANLMRKTKAPVLVPMAPLAGGVETRTTRNRASIKLR